MCYVYRVPRVPFKTSEETLAWAKVAAKNEGVSLDEWISDAIMLRVNNEHADKMGYTHMSHCPPAHES